MAGIRGMKWGMRKEKQIIRLNNRIRDINKYISTNKSFRTKFLKRKGRIEVAVKRFFKQGYY